MGVFIKKPGDKDRSPEVLPYNTIRPLTASAAKITPTDKTEIDYLVKRKSSQHWQTEAWEYYDAIGEIHYAFGLFADVLSRIRLHAAYVSEDRETPITISSSEASDEAKKAAHRAMNRVFGGSAQSGILRKAGINLLVTGECYLVGDYASELTGRAEKWSIASNDELVPIAGKGFGLKTRRDQRAEEITVLNAQSFIGRIWKEHARYSDEPDSSMKALLDLCGELLLLNRTVRATARSRLNAGALFVPDVFSVSRDVPTDDISDGLEPYLDEESDQFEEELIDAMTTPLSDESSAASVVPLLIRGPIDAGEKIRLIKFERSFDAQLSNRADRSLERILQGIDLPKEIVTGLANIKYSNAIQINESLYTAHIEPLILMLCDAIRTIYLVPALKKAGLDPEEIEKIIIWYDPSGITTAPDKSAAANIGFQSMAISAKAWRYNNGFSEDDAPTELEIGQRIAMSRGQLNDSLTEALLKTLIPDVIKDARAASQEANAAPIPPGVEDVLDGNAQAPPLDPTNPVGGPPPQNDPAPEATEEPPPGLMQ